MNKNKILLLFLTLFSSSSCATEEVITYGLKGSYKVATPVDMGKAVIYYPAKIKNMKALPVVFFIPGWKSTNHRSYRLILSFIASHGYVAILAKDDQGEFRADYLETYLTDAIKKFPFKLDTSKIGIIGYSSGGGHAFSILNNLSKNQKWGKNGRFIFSLDPWFSFDMNKKDMQTLPSNTNVIVMKFANDHYLTDTRISINQFSLLKSIAKHKKDYHFNEEADHSYVFKNKNVKEQDKILKPLDGLLIYSFEDSKNEEARKVALNVGRGVNFKDVWLAPQDKYRYRCDGHDNSKAYTPLAKTDIDYCAIERLN
jgi:hypothetical protein